jgi:hypothetical protein
MHLVIRKTLRIYSHCYRFQCNSYFLITNCTVEEYSHIIYRYTSQDTNHTYFLQLCYLTYAKSLKERGEKP